MDETIETIEINYTSATHTSKLEQATGPKRLRFRNNRQAAAERQFLALQAARTTTQPTQSAAASNPENEHGN